MVLILRKVDEGNLCTHQLYGHIVVEAAIVGVSLAEEVSGCFTQRNVNDQHKGNVCYPHTLERVGTGLMFIILEAGTPANKRTCAHLINHAPTVIGGIAVRIEPHCIRAGEVSPYAQSVSCEPTPSSPPSQSST